jgi:hypothetical protein
MSSETRIPHGEVPASRHGRLLAAVAYQSNTRWWRRELGTSDNEWSVDEEWSSMAPVDEEGGATAQT